MLPKHVNSLYRTVTLELHVRSSLIFCLLVFGPLNGKGIKVVFISQTGMIEVAVYMQLMWIRIHSMPLQEIFQLLIMVMLGAAIS